MRKNLDQHLETVRNIVVEILRTELNPSLYQQDLHLLHKSIPFLIYLLELTGIEWKVLLSTFSKNFFA